MNLKCGNNIKYKKSQGDDECKRKEKVEGQK